MNVPLPLEEVDPRWERCTRCQHYRLEHASGRRCQAADPSKLTRDVVDACDCKAFAS